MLDRMSSNWSRRTFLQVGGAAGLALVGIGCSKKEAAPTCTDTTGMSEPDVATRTNFAYVDATPDPTKPCSTCQQYTPAPSASACGGCKLVKGPISPSGTCKLWVAKV